VRSAARIVGVEKESVSRFMFKNTYGLIPNEKFKVGEIGLFTTAF
jgi:hypothetical protein